MNSKLLDWMKNEGYVLEEKPSNLSEYKAIDLESEDLVADLVLKEIFGLRPRNNLFIYGTTAYARYADELPSKEEFGPIDSFRMLSRQVDESEYLHFLYEAGRNAGKARDLLEIFSADYIDRHTKGYFSKAIKEGHLLLEED